MSDPYGVPERTMEPSEFAEVSGSLQTEQAEKMEFEKVENSLFLIEYGEKDGRAIFHIFSTSRETEWGRLFAPKLKRALEDVFIDGEMEWIPEAVLLTEEGVVREANVGSWFFRPAKTPLDYLAAAKAVLSRLMR